MSTEQQPRKPKTLGELLRVYPVETRIAAATLVLGILANVVLGPLDSDDATEWVRMCIAERSGSVPPRVEALRSSGSVYGAPLHQPHEIAKLGVELDCASRRARMQMRRIWFGMLGMFLVFGCGGTVIYLRNRPDPSLKRVAGR